MGSLEMVLDFYFIFYEYKNREEHDLYFFFIIKGLMGNLGLLP
jgi:hypothetical protein